MIAKKVFLLVICMSFCFEVHCQIERDTLFINLQKEVQLASNDSSKIKALINLGDYHITRDFRKAEPYLLEALKYIQKGPKNSQNRQQAALYEALGIVNKRKGDYPEAISFYLKSQKLYETIKDSSNIADIHHNIAMVFRDQKEYKKSISYFKKAIAIKKKLGEASGVAIGYNMMGVAYRQAKQMDSALFYYQKAKNTFIGLNDKENIYNVNSNLAAWYHSQKEYRKAIEIYTDNLVFDQQNNKLLSLQRVHYNIAGSYMQLKEYTTALEYIEKALAMAKEQNAKTRISRAYLRSSFLNKQLGNYEKALNDYRLHKKYSDSIFNVENAKKIQALELTHQFNQEKLADSLQFVKQKRELELITQAESSKKRLYLTLLITAVLAGIVIAYLIRKIYKNRALLALRELEKNKQELADFTQQLIKKSNEQEALSKELEELKSEFGEKEALKNLQELTASKILTKEDWYTFRKKFTNVHPGFFTKIKHGGFELTQSEERLIAMEKLGLDTKQIANMLAISEDSVMMNRYRLRKKINAPKGAPILDYLEQN